MGRNNYIFIDFENVQKVDLKLIVNKPRVQVILVHGTQQKLSLDLVPQIIKLGAQVQFVKVEGSGKNALDFVLAYQLGNRAKEDKEGYFHIVSRDTGFDALIKHLKAEGIFARRVEGFEDIPALKDYVSAPVEELASIARDRIIKTAEAQRPKRAKTLLSMVRSLFRKELPEERVQAVCDKLLKKKVSQYQPGEQIGYAI